MPDDTKELSQNQLWSVILAGGDGERMRPSVVQQWGEARPKQYCTFTGKRSLFQHTVDRVLQVSAPRRTFIVIARAHQTYCWEELWGRPSGKILLQPLNRDTVPGLFLPLTHIHAQAPNSTVVVCPSDHFIYPESRFVETVHYAGLAVDRLTDNVILLGAVPDNLEMDHSWILPGRTLAWTKGVRVHGVQRICDERTLEADAVRSCGVLWNTMILVAKVETLWRLGWQLFPDMMVLFHELNGALNSAGESVVLNEIYRTMPARNLLSHFLLRIQDRLAVITLDDVIWSDWDSPGRVKDSLDRVARLTGVHHGSNAVR